MLDSPNEQAVRPRKLKKPKKPKKPKKQKKRVPKCNSITKDVLSLAIANGTLNELLWDNLQKLPVVDMKGSVEIDYLENSMEDLSTKIWNQMLLRKGLPPEDLKRSQRKPNSEIGSNINRSPRLRHSKLISHRTYQYDEENGLLPVVKEGDENPAAQAEQHDVAQSEQLDDGASGIYITQLDVSPSTPIFDSVPASLVTSTES